MKILAESGLRVDLIEARDEERASATEPTALPEGLARVVKLLQHELDIAGVRRVGLAGADEQTAHLGPWLASHQTNFLLLAAEWGYLFWKLRRLISR